MDEFDPNAVTAEDTQAAADGKNQKLIFAALALAGVSMLFGVAAMFMANQAGKRLQEMQTVVQELQAKPDTSMELKTAVTDIDNRLMTFGDQIVRLNNVDRQLQDGLRRSTEATGTELRTLREAVAETRTAVVDLNRAVTDLREAGVSAPRVATATTQAAPATAATVTTVDGMRVHTVRAGENPSRIAAIYGVTVDSILQANPGLNPQRMQVGQQIVVPAPAQ